MGTHQINKLRQSKSQFDKYSVVIVGDRSDETIVGAEQVIIQPLGVRVSLAEMGAQKDGCHKSQNRAQKYSTTGH